MGKQSLIAKLLPGRTLIASARAGKSEYDLVINNSKNKYGKVRFRDRINASSRLFDNIVLGAAAETALYALPTTAWYLQSKGQISPEAATYTTLGSILAGGLISASQNNRAAQTRRQIQPAPINSDSQELNPYRPTD